MKRLSIVLLFFLTGACEKNDAPWDHNCVNGDCSYTVHAASHIQLNYSSHSGAMASIVPGNNNVFEYRFVYADDPSIADDEYSDTLLFETTPGLTQFNFSGEEQLAEAGAVFRRSCYCGFVGFFPVTGGTITGKQLSPILWRVTADIEIAFGDFTLYMKSSGLYAP